MAHLLRRLFAPIPAGALALGLVVGLTLPLARPWLQRSTPEAQMPSSYVGVLADAEGRPGLVVSARRLGRQLDVQQAMPLGLPDGRTLYLWAIDPSGAARRVGPLPAGPTGRLVLDDDAHSLLASAVELAVSVERTDTPPDGPAGAFVYRGPCERMWRVTPPTAWIG
jgi:anti-sigma-K factor RskA